jgi:hypothetical protein
MMGFPWKRLFGRRRNAATPEPICKANDADCFPSPSNPKPLCPRGYCMVHCSCVCRGSCDNRLAQC